MKSMIAPPAGQSRLERWLTQNLTRKGKPRTHAGGVVPATPGAWPTLPARAPSRIVRLPAR